MTTPDLPISITREDGQPATTRVGTVESVAPLVISLGGQRLLYEAVGVSRDYSPVVGDRVVLLGQSVEGAGSTAATWAALGAIQNGASTRPEQSTLATFQVEANFDSATYNVVAGEQLIGGGIALTVSLPAGHLVGLHATFQHANTLGVTAATRVRFRETNLAGAIYGSSRDLLPGPGNLYYAGRLDQFVRSATSRTVTFVITTQAVITGVGQWGMTVSDLFWATDYGLNANVQ